MCKRLLSFNQAIQAHRFTGEDTLFGCNVENQHPAQFLAVLVGLSEPSAQISPKYPLTPAKVLLETRLRTHQEKLLIAYALGMNGILLKISKKVKTI